MSFYITIVSVRTKCDFVGNEKGFDHGSVEAMIMIDFRSRDWRWSSFDT